MIERRCNSARSQRCAATAYLHRDRRRLPRRPARPARGFALLAGDITATCAHTRARAESMFVSMRPAWASQRCAGAAGRRSAPCVRNSSLLWGSRLHRAGASGRAGQAQCKHSTDCRQYGASHLTSQDVELSRKAQRRSRSSRTAGATQQFWRQ